MVESKGYLKKELYDMFEGDIIDIEEAKDLTPKR